MTQERFFQMIDDPDLLRRITYEELKTLVLAYPYAHNLRCMLALKAAQVEHPDANKNLASAAAYSLDRTRLFLLVAPQVVAPQALLKAEEVLELKPIETVKRELEALAPVVREEKTEEALKAIEAPAEEPPLPYEPIPEEEPVLEKTVEISVIAAPLQSFSDWFGKFQPPVLESKKEKSIIVPTPVEEEEKPRESPKTSGIAQQLAEKSVAENQDVISETLAKLYAKQGYRDKSAQMYARLALLFPEKSAYFAAEIDKLKK